MRTVNSFCLLVAVAFLVSCQSRPTATAKQCWNPRILQIRVGSAIFNFPKEVDSFDFPKRINSYGEPLSTPGGIETVPDVLEINSEEQIRNRAYRSNCNKKGAQPVSAGDELVGKYRGSPGTDRAGEVLDFAVYKYKSQSRYNGFDHARDYVGDIADVDKIKFLGFGAGHKTGMAEGVEAIFGFQAHTFVLNCTIWKDAKFPENKSPRSPFLDSCAPKIGFRADDVIIALGIPPTSKNNPEKQYLVPPPQQWPAYWAGMAKLLASYRVDDGHGVLRQK